MTRKTFIVGIVVIFVLIMFSGYQSYNLYHDTSKLKGQNEMLKIQKADLEIKNKVLRDKEEANIKEFKQDIQDLGKEVAKKEIKIAEKTEMIDILEDALPTLHDKDEIIINLKEQNKLLRENFSLALSEIESLKGQVIKWELTYNAQAEISEAWKEVFLKERALRKNTDSLVKGLERRLKKRQLNSTLSKVAIGALGGIVIYGLVAK